MDPACAEAGVHRCAPWPPDLEADAEHDPLLALLLRGHGPAALVRRLRRPDDATRRAVERVLSTPCAYDLPALRWDAARVDALPPAARRRARADFDEAARALRGRTQGLYLAALAARGDPRLSERLRGCFPGASVAARLQIGRALLEDGAPTDRGWLDALATLLDDDPGEPDSFMASMGARAEIARGLDGGLRALTPRLKPEAARATPWRAKGVLEALATHGQVDRAWLPHLRPLLLFQELAEDAATVLARYALDAGWADDLAASISAAFDHPGVVLDQRLALLAPIADARAIPALTRALRQNPGVGRIVAPALARLGIAVP
ncbi:MAG: hypothetical protein U0325_00950 [Polyangiales bacterium]